MLTLEPERTKINSMLTREESPKISSSKPSLEEEIQNCMKCGFCRAVCPIFVEFKEETYSPRGRLRLVRAMLKGETAFTEGWHDAVFRCLICKACVEECPSGVEVDKLILKAREEEVKDKGLSLGKRAVFRYFMRARRLFPSSAILLGILQRVGLLFWRYSPARLLFPFLGMPMTRSIPIFTLKPFLWRYPEVIPPKGERKGRVAYFVGCATNLIFPHIGEAVVKILRHLGMEVVIPKGQMCCGTPLFISGDVEGARYLAERNAEILSRLDVDYIITACASGGLALKKEWQRVLDLDWDGSKVRDIAEFLQEVGLPQDLRPLNLRVTYHDPCHLNRGQGIKEEPRKLISSLPGVEFVEMEEADRCCGGAGTFNLFFYDTSVKVGMRKRERILETKADAVATVCPSCIMQLKSLLPHRVKVMHVAELVERALTK